MNKKEISPEEQDRIEAGFPSTATKREKKREFKVHDMPFTWLWMFWFAGTALFFFETVVMRENFRQSDFILLIWVVIATYCIFRLKRKVDVIEQNKPEGGDGE